MKKSVLCIFFVFLTCSIYAQDAGIEDPNAIELPADSTAAPIQRGILTTFKTVFQGKPGRAAFYSLIIPGGGQLYNRKYWKAPIVWAVDGAAIYWYVYNRQNYRGFRDAYSLSFTDPTANYRGIASQQGLRQFRNKFQLQSERAGIIVVVLHLFSIIEAFTDRHLQKFDVDENLSLEFKPVWSPTMGATSAIGLTYSF